MTQKIATILGGTGFVGRQVVRALAKLGYRVKVATRVPERAYFLRPGGVVGQIVPVVCRYDAPASIEAVIAGSQVVVNCIGILFEKGKRQNFKQAHIDIPEWVAQACVRQRVERLVHISAMGIEKSSSDYAKTKLAGEAGVLNACPYATILQPSVIFGEDDNFFNMFARMAQIMPFLPLIGGGKTRFQPVYVGDVADAVIAALTLPAFGPQNPQGQTYALGGPEVLDFRQIYERLFREIGFSRPLVTISFDFARMQGCLFEMLMPRPLLTADQVESLKADSVASPGMPGFAALGLTPRSLDVILPTYLVAYRPGGRFGDKKAA